jgi:dihydroneopterin aldolase
LTPFPTFPQGGKGWILLTPWGKMKGGDTLKKDENCKLKSEIMGLIKIENMEFYSFHGHFKEERIVGNKFLVDLTIETDMNLAAASDNLKDAVNYQRIYDIVKSQMEMKSHLLEHIAGRILDAIYAEMEGVENITVKVSKLNPPMGGKIGSVSVVMTR